MTVRQDVRWHVVEFRATNWLGVTTSGVMQISETAGFVRKDQSFPNH
jgi:hypothetical protein